MQVYGLAYRFYDPLRTVFVVCWVESVNMDLESREVETKLYCEADIVKVRSGSSPAPAPR